MLYQGNSSQIPAQSRNNSPHEQLFADICLSWVNKEFANTQALQKPSSQHDNSPHECCSLGFYYAIEISDG